MKNVKNWVLGLMATMILYGLWYVMVAPKGHPAP